MSRRSSRRPSSSTTSAPSGGASGSTRMPVWSSPTPSSRAEQIMPSLTCPIGLARGDGEAAGQYGAGQRDRHPVADGEVTGTADDPPGAGAGVHLAAADGLAVAGDELLDGEHLADQYAGDIGADRLNPLDLQADPQQRIRRLSGGVRWQVDVAAQPGQRDPHQASIPKANVNRTSPSTRSRMSGMSCRNIRVRSSPIPRAKQL